MVVTCLLYTSQVIYSKYSGTDVELDGEEYIVVKQSDILAVIK